MKIETRKKDAGTSLSQHEAWLARWQRRRRRRLLLLVVVVGCGWRINVMRALPTCEKKCNKSTEKRHGGRRLALRGACGVPAEGPAPSAQRAQRAQPLVPGLLQLQMPVI